jgi:exodeoxyribonuclease-1
MTRALRPEGIKWPFAPDSKPTNRLQFLTSINKLDHANAHDALGDVLATIEVARLIKIKQPDLFKYLLEHRAKNSVRALVESNQPFVYTNGHYPSRYNHTSIAVCVAKHLDQDAALVYDLRYDPSPYLKMTTEQLIEEWRYTPDSDKLRLPVKTIKYNRAPAVAPLGVVSDNDTLTRLDLSLLDITKNLKILKADQASFAGRLVEAVKTMDENRDKVQADLVTDELSVDALLYDGFIDQADQALMSKIRTEQPAKLGSYLDKLKDRRLVALLPLYKARNYPNKLETAEREAWESYLQRKLFSGGESSIIGQYMKRLEEYGKSNTNKEQAFLIEELKLYAQSLIPADAIG